MDLWEIMFESVDGIQLILGRVYHAEPLDGIEAEFVLMRGVKLQRRLYHGLTTLFTCSSIFHAHKCSHMY